jgi:hypothetical protein
MEVVIEPNWDPKEERALPRPNSEMDKSPELPPKTFDQLIAEGADCIEMSLYGFIRMYEEGEPLCECKGCKAAKEFNDRLNFLYKRKGV